VHDRRTIRKPAGGDDAKKESSHHGERTTSWRAAAVQRQGREPTMRSLIAVAVTLASQLQRAAASDITLKLDVSVFGLDLAGDGEEAGGAGGGMAGMMSTMLDDAGNIVVIEDGAPNTFLIALTTLVPIPESYEGVTLDEVTMEWSSPTELAYSLDVQLEDIPAHLQAGWRAANIMNVPVLSVPTSGRLPATPDTFTVSLECVTVGKARMSFTFSVCEDPAATWDADSSSCSVGAVQETSFVVDKECGGANVLPTFCAPAAPTAASGWAAGAPAPVSIFNLNVAEGAGIDRTKLVEKGTAIAAVIAAKGSDIACLQEVWDEGERAALIDGLAAAGLTHSVAARGAGLVIASRHPILQCGSATFDSSSYGGTIEAFTDKGVLGALLDLGGGALLYVRTVQCQY